MDLNPNCFQASLTLYKAGWYAQNIKVKNSDIKQLKNLFQTILTYIDSYMCLSLQNLKINGNSLIAS